MTVRGVFYQAVSRGLVAKTENEYSNTIDRLLVNMRESGELPYQWITDNGRWMRKPRSYSSLETMLYHSHQMYRRALWDSQRNYVEVWIEKDAMSGVFYDVTSKWDVPLMVTRGYPSLTFLYEAAETIDGTEKPAFIYYFGDYDPSGVNIFETVERKIQQRTKSWIHIERIAVTPEQIERYSLPTRPTKKTDRRAGNFKGDSVELDAMTPNVLRQIAENCITQHIDNDALDGVLMAESAEKETLSRIIEGMI